MYRSLVQPLYGLPALTISPSKQQWLTDLPNTYGPFTLQRITDHFTL